MWPEWSRKRLDERFAAMFVHPADTTVVVVDRRDVHYVVQNMDEVEWVWRRHAIAYALVVPNHLFEKHRGDVVITALSELEVTF